MLTVCSKNHNYVTVYFCSWWCIGNVEREGGLGVLDISVQNESLLLKHLHKFYNRAPIPWVQLVWDKYYARNRLSAQNIAFRGSFWWRNILKLINKFKGLAVLSLQDGQSCFLWHDLWGTDICSQRFPELFSFAKNTMITVSGSHYTTPSWPLSATFVHWGLYMINFSLFQISSKDYSFKIFRTLGHTFGVPLHLPPTRPIKYLLVIDRFRHLSNGFGVQHVRTKGKFSSGCSWKTG